MMTPKRNKATLNQNALLKYSRTSIFTVFTVVTEIGFRFLHFGFLQRTDALICAYQIDISAVQGLLSN
jgi:hypothetical protein